MPAFDPANVDWSAPDATAIVETRGVLTVTPADLEPLRDWLVAESYAIHDIDFGVSFEQTLAQLGSMLEWQRQFGYRLEDGGGNLDAVNDGFNFPAELGGRTALVVLHADSPRVARSWVRGLLSIAAAHTTYHLAVGARFLTVLPLSPESTLVGDRFDAAVVLPPQGWE